MRVTPDVRCRPSFSRSINRGRETTLGRGGGTYSLVAKIGADIVSLYNVCAWLNHCALQRNDDIALLVSGVHVAVRLDDLFQGIAPINDHSDFSRFNQIFDAK